MALPLLVFPRRRAVPPVRGRGFPRNPPRFPGHARQVQRIRPQLDELQEDFARYKGSMSHAALGLEPETTLVIEIAGTVERFKQAVEAVGLEWLGEWDIEDIDPDEDFYDVNKSSEKKDTLLAGQLFLSMVNESGLQALLRLWGRWGKNKDLPHGMTKWRDVFKQTKEIRLWGVKDSLIDTGMVENWRENVSPDVPNQSIVCQIELFFRKDPRKRREAEETLKRLLEESGGKMRGKSLENPNIGMHAVKAELAPASVLALLDEVDKGEVASSGRKSLSMSLSNTMRLFEFHGIMYFRLTGQSLTAMREESGIPAEFPKGKPELQPAVVAILDGVPNQMHDALKNRIVLDDRDDLSGQYPPVGGKNHGTAMASLVIHGDASRVARPLDRQVYCRPIMQFDERAGMIGEHREYVPSDIFIEDRVERAVRDMLDETSDRRLDAPSVKIINFSIGITDRPFRRIPSPLAMLLDWLSWKYQVLFCVSAGNYGDDFDLGLTYPEFSRLPEQERVKHTLGIIAKQLFDRRLLSPAESLNAVTVGALHSDESGNDWGQREQRFDPLPGDMLLSPISRLGLGFRRSVKPEVFFCGGRQFYGAMESNVGPSVDYSGPGQRTAWDSPEPGELSRAVYTRGTSNAAALATRSASKIYDVVRALQEEHKDQIPDKLLAVLIKTLLVHAAEQSGVVKRTFIPILRNLGEARKLKELMSRFVGYGAANVERVLSCTEQRATVIACGEMDTGHVHEYQFPLPSGLSGQRIWRRMIVTLAWFSPISPRHRNYRMAKLSIAPPHKWGETPLHLPERPDSDYNQVKRGTVQHEILEGRRKIAVYAQGDHLTLRVLCRPDAAETLEDPIPYGLAVTLEVAEDVNIPIYSQIREGIRMQIPVEPSLESQNL